MVPGEENPRKNGPREKRTHACARVCVCEMLGCNQSMKTQNSETNNRGVSVDPRGVCACGMFGYDQSMKAQDSTTNFPGLL